MENMYKKQLAQGQKPKEDYNYLENICTSPMLEKHSTRDVSI